MKALVDVNVVFALLVERHMHHPAAWRWWQEREPGEVALCLPVRLGVLRLLTNTRAMEDAPVGPEEALSAWDALEADGRTCPLDHTSMPTAEAFFRRNVDGRTPSPNLWTDALLAAWAEASNIRLASFDGGFRAFPSLDFEWLGR